MADYRKLGRPTDQRKALLRNQVSNLLWYGKIETTQEKAKEVRRLAEKLITLAMNTYEDTVKVTKQVKEVKMVKNKETKKLEKTYNVVEKEFVNDGPKKLVARRKIMANTYDLPGASPREGEPLCLCRQNRRDQSSPDRKDLQRACAQVCEAR